MNINFVSHALLHKERITLNRVSNEIYSIGFTLNHDVEEKLNPCQSGPLPDLIWSHDMLCHIVCLLFTWIKFNPQLCVIPILIKSLSLNFTIIKVALKTGGGHFNAPLPLRVK